MSGIAFVSSVELHPRLCDWVRLNPDRTLSIFNGKVELGQGIGTAIAQIAADELEVPFDRLILVSGDTSRCPNEWWTSASISIEAGGRAMRTACAEVREAFRAAAARRLDAAIDDVEVRLGWFSATGSSAKLSYWDLVAEVDLAQRFSGTASLKPPGAYRVVGRSVPRRDLPAKLAGAAYVHDLDLPGLLHGRVLRPPSYGARLVSIDRAMVQSVAPLAAMVVDGSFVGVCAEREEAAIKAVEAVRNAAHWTEPVDLPEPGEVRSWLLELPRDSDRISAKGTFPEGDGRCLAAAYSKPYIAHASIGPACAVARLKNGHLTVWSHTQGNFVLKSQLARALGMAEVDITVIHHDGAGCYGHNGADDVALDAALLSIAVGHPVQVVWSREDELAWAPFGSAMAIDLKARVMADGRITEWVHEVYSTPHLTRPGWGEGVGLLAAWHLATPFEPPVVANPPLALGGGGDRNAIPLYEFATQSVVHHFVKAAPLRVSALRSLGAYGNVFAIESFVDEISHTVGIDAVELRLMHLADERARAVVRAAAGAATGAAAPPSDGLARGRGMGFARYKNSGAYFAVVVEVSVEKALRVERAWAAVDAGLIVNPDGLSNQIEGGIVQAISWTLFEEVRWDRERVLTRSWDDYPILRFADVPAIEVELIGRPDQPSLGVGECAAGPTAAAIANALFDALGVRVRDLPLTPERIARSIQ